MLEQEKINLWFGNLEPAIKKYRWLIILAVLLVTFIQGTGMKNIQLVTSNDSWLLENDPLRLAKEDFEGIFGNDEFIVVLLEAEDVFSASALQANRELSETLLREVPLADEVHSLSDMEFTRATEQGMEVGNLIPEKIPEDQSRLREIRDLAMSKEILVDRMFSRDGKATIIALELKPYPDEEGSKLDLDYQTEITARVKEIAGRPEYQEFDIAVGGVPVMVEGEMRWGSEEMKSIFGVAALVMAIILAFCFRSLTAVTAPLCTAIFSTVFMLGFFGWFNIAIQELMLIIPLVLALVLSIGYNVHILSFFRQEMKCSGQRDLSISMALENAALPILLTVITTAVGLLAFLVVPVSSVRLAGVTSAGLLLAAYPLVIVLTPALLTFGGNQDPRPEQLRESPATKLMAGAASFTESRGKLIISVFALLAAIFSAAIPFLDIDTDYTRTMGEKVPFIRDGMHISRSIGSLYSYEIAVDFGGPGTANRPENLKALQKLGRELSTFNTVKRCNSINDIVKDLNTTTQGGSQEHHVIPDDPHLLSRLLLLYETSGGDDAEEWIDKDYRYARMQVELARFTSSGVEAQVDFIRRRMGELVPGSSVIITGLATTFASVANYIVRGQIWSIAIALSVISMVMMLVFGSFKLGLIGMIPNIFPIILCLGAMSMANTPLHIITMIVAPMIVGVAVDDTIHFVSHFRREFAATGSYSKANLRTFTSVGKALFLTSAIICAGFAAFLHSELLAYSHIGIYTIVAIAGALAADLFVTPVLILWTRPFGKE